jgi:hypothetical protein
VKGFDRIGPDLNIGIDTKLAKCRNDIIEMNFSHGFSLVLIFLITETQGSQREWLKKIKISSASLR